MPRPEDGDERVAAAEASSGQPPGEAVAPGPEYADGLLAELMGLDGDAHGEQSRGEQSQGEQGDSEQGDGAADHPGSDLTGRGLISWRHLTMPFGLQ